MWESFAFFYEQGNKVVLCAGIKKSLHAQFQQKGPLIVDYVDVYDNWGDLGDSVRGNIEESEWSIYQECKTAQDNVTRTIV